MPAGAFTGARHLSYDDVWLAAGVGSKDFKDLLADFDATGGTGMDFRPQAIHCNSSSDQDEQDLGYAQVRGLLFGENNDNFIDTYRVPLGVPVGLAFRRVYATGTTARGLKIISEI